MESTSLIIFCLVYLGMLLGNLPGLALDRTGIALLGAIAFIELQNKSFDEVTSEIDFSTIAILFSFMIISAQFYYSGFYTYVIEQIEKWKISPAKFLLIVILISGLLSAVLINDIVCLAMTPLLINCCVSKKLNPIPFLLGLACSSNIGSALTLIGNPQNMLIGQALQIPFLNYIIDASVPCILGLFVAWWIIKWQTGKNWHAKIQTIAFKSIPIDKWECIKGGIILLVLLFIFCFTTSNRGHVSLAAAGILLLSRRMASRMMLSFIDWQLLVLFICLFIVNNSFMKTEIMHHSLDSLQGGIIDLQSPKWIFSISAVLSNLVSNVPAVMLLLPFVKDQFTGTLLALSSTLAGNLFIVGSLANIIVVTQAANCGIHIDWRKHIRVGIPISIITLALAAIWLSIRNSFLG